MMCPLHLLKKIHCNYNLELNHSTFKSNHFVSSALIALIVNQSGETPHLLPQYKICC